MRLVFKVSLILIILSLTAACNGTVREVAPTPTVEGAVAVDITFREFYQNLGGVEILGPAINGTMENPTLICQYTENALMCFSKVVTDTERFFLYPLGTTFDIDELQGEALNNNSDRVVNDIPIFEGFQEIYDDLYGARYVGKPLTTVRFNPLKNRIEQYFENVGFYQNLDEGTANEVRLLAYGLYGCNVHCRYKGPDTENAITDIPSNVDFPFLPYIMRMGNPIAFGDPITRAFSYNENEIQQVLENVVVLGNPNQWETVRLLNVPELLGFYGAAPGPQIYSEEHKLTFYPVDGPNGYHVPLAFNKFISENGGLSLSGNPIGAVYEIEPNKIARQCFQNYCLDYFANRPEGKNVSMVPLGDAYLSYANLNEDLVVKFKFTPDSLIFNISETKTQVSATEEQHIDIVVLRKKDEAPLENIESLLVLTLPDGSREQYNVPPTNENGKSQFTIPPIPGLENGLLIQYEVCLNVPADEQICKQDNYMIWEHQ